MPSPYATVYFADIVGAPSKPGAIKDIPGIETPDDSTIVFKLKGPSAALVSQALAMPISTPVPEEYAKKFDAKTPSTYDQYVVFTGPYMYKNDASGKLTGRSPGKSIELVRNPNWDPKTDYRPAYLDSITIEEGNDDAVSSARRVLNGKGLVQGDGTTPAPVIKQALSRNKDQIAFIPGGGYRFISMNSTIKPFDNLDVRKAVVAASDRKALQLTRGGTAAGDLATHFLPLDFPGFEEAGGAKGPRWTSWPTRAATWRWPRSTCWRPRSRTRACRSTPTACGRTPAAADGGLQRRPGQEDGRGRAGPVREAGFKIKFRAVPQDTLYTKFCNVPAQKIAICPNVGWFKDFNDPQAVLDAGVQRQEHPAPEQLQLDAAQRPGHQQRDGEGRAAARRPRAQQGVGQHRRHGHGAGSRAIPYLWDKIPTVEASDVRGVVNQYSTSWDLDFTSLK